MSGLEFKLRSLTLLPSSAAKIPKQAVSEVFGPWPDRLTWKTPSAVRVRAKCSSLKQRATMQLVNQAVATCNNTLAQDVARETLPV
jgi:hypothetical protein